MLNDGKSCMISALSSCAQQFQLWKSSNNSKMRLVCCVHSTFRSVPYGLNLEVLFLSNLILSFSKQAWYVPFASYTISLGVVKAHWIQGCQSEVILCLPGRYNFQLRFTSSTWKLELVFYWHLAVHGFN